MGGTLGGSHTGFTVASRLVGQGEFTQISPNHVKLNLHIIEAFPIVHSHKVAHHLGHHNRITKVSLDWSWLLSWKGVLFCFLALQIQPIVFMFDFWMMRDGYFWQIFCAGGPGTTQPLAPVWVRTAVRGCCLWNYIFGVLFPFSVLSTLWIINILIFISTHY